MQIAADVPQLEKGRQLSVEGLLAELRRTPRSAERSVHVLLGRRLRQRLEGGDVRGRAGRAHERGPEPLRLGDQQLDRHALDRQADSAALAPVDERDDLGQRLEAGEQRLGIGRGADDRQQFAGIAPAPRVAGRLAADRSRDACYELPGSVEQEAAPRARLGPTRERLDELRLGLRTDAPDAPDPARGSRFAKLLCSAHAQRSGELDEAPRPES
jgi:hypothetical protein